MKIILGSIISHCRKYCGFTQEYMAHKLGYTTHTYANIEHGRVDISVSKLVVLAQIFGIQAHQILNLAEEVSANGDDNCSPEVIKGMIRLTNINQQTVNISQVTDLEN